MKEKKNLFPSILLCSVPVRLQIKVTDDRFVGKKKAEFTCSACIHGGETW